ncbi:YfiR family protein [Enterobacteriaceae bacterium 89]|nr:YfiR family protein [Enterobacteriaceae bacterium 89]
MNISSLDAWRFQVSTRWGQLSGRLIATLFLLCAYVPAFAEPAGSDNAVRDIVSGIVSYTRWPALNGPPVLCVFASSPYTTAFSQNAASTTTYKTVIVQNEQDALSAQCNALYFGRESAEQQQQILNRFQNTPLLTIAEQNAECIIGSAFCLRVNSERVTFSVNLDALSRSGVRVNPDVLMLARNKNHE